MDSARRGVMIGRKPAAHVEGARIAVTQPQRAPGACTACGDCVPVCPVAAITVAPPSQHPPRNG